MICCFKKRYVSKLCFRKSETCEKEIQSNREGERDSEENRDESDVDSDDEIDSESECEQSEDETFRKINKFVEIEYEMEYY